MALIFEENILKFAYEMQNESKIIEFIKDWFRNWNIIECVDSL